MAVGVGLRRRTKKTLPTLTFQLTPLPNSAIPSCVDVSRVVVWMKGQLTMETNQMTANELFDVAIPFAGDVSANTFYRAIYIGDAWDVVCRTTTFGPATHLPYRVAGEPHNYYPAFAKLRRLLHADGWPHLSEPRPRYRTRRRTATA